MSETPPLEKQPSEPTSKGTSPGGAGLVVKCARCGHGLQVTGAMAGKKAKCSHCGHVFRIPASPGQAATEGSLEPGSELATVSTPGQPSTVAYRPGNEDVPAAASFRPGSASLDLPARFGRYRLEKELGKGGMGAVYLAYDTQLDRHVALKVPMFGQDEGGRRERFFQEARAAATLNHPNLCPVFDIGELDGVCYLTMAYIDGKPLSDYIRADRPFLPATAAALVRVLAKALQEAHDHGIIHRDLKPSNILINRKKTPIITDFGLARRASSQDERLTHSGELMGTPAYMPPEQVNGDVAAMGPGCDIYSLGVILYELLANRRPFQGAMGMLMAKIVMDPPPPPSQFRPELDPALEAICLRALAKRPEDRYPSMRAFAEALEAWLAAKASPSAGPDSSRPLAANTEPLALLDEPDTVTPTATRRATVSARRIKKRSGRAFHLTRGQVWMILACMLLFTTCVLPVTCVAVVVYHTVNKVSDGAKEASHFFQDLKKDQDHQLQEREKEQQQWEEVARTWQAPPSNAALARLFPAAVGEHRRIEQDDQAQVTELNVWAPGRRAVYRDSIAMVELFVYRATKPEKEVILRKVQQAVSQRLAASGLMQANPNVRGSPEGMFLSYDLEPSGAGAEQHGTFWWQKGWLFLARSGNPQAPGLFLKEYLTAISHN